ncbi:Lar family restriction alleviation protein [Brevibacillus porteri]|uniref:Lar family restriction alleviation protein n=1 Tax=Brevibacillus porteri TaxID=2126350 RepID=UPI00362FF55E
MYKLLPCPFCGQSPKLETMTVRKGYEASIHCTCSASIHTITCDTVSEATSSAVSTWNRRTEVAV